MFQFTFYLTSLLLFVVFAVYLERKVAAFIQNRLGPMVVGPKGIFQSFADMLKMLQKEDIRPQAIDYFTFLIAPLVVFCAVFSGYALLPINNEISGAMLSSGAFFLLAVISLDVLGILMAGWSSNNKFSLYGAMRAVAQIISYEIPFGISVLCVIILNSTLDLQKICTLQDGNGFLSWNIIRHPVLFVPFIIFFITSLAKANRSPFDLPESESELVGGYSTEYSGFRWGIFMLSEYGMMLLMSLLAVTLFFGGWNTPLPNLGNLTFHDMTNSGLWGIFWLFSKSLLLIFIQMWIRWTVPRLRVDQLMSLSWKYLTPISIVMIFICSIWKIVMYS